MDTQCGVSVNLSQLPSSTTPLHIVLWKGVDTANPSVTSTSQPLNLETNDTIKRLLDRITVLESMVSGLLETHKSSLWFSQGLRPTPTGIDVVSRRESMGDESDIVTVLSQLVRPSDADIRTVNIACPSVSTALPPNVSNVVPTVGTDEQEVEEQGVEEQEVEEEQELEVEEEQELEVEEQEVEEDQEVEVDEQDEIIDEYTQIQWKGKTYYVDANKEVYEMDSDGDLIDVAIGIWREETQKLVRYKAP
jgi:hypothetical protein